MTVQPPAVPAVVPTPAVPAPPTVPVPPPDQGFPDKTPLEQMTGTQREAYWKHYSRSWENKAKAFEGLTPEQLTTLRDKAAKADALERDSMSDKDKAVAAAQDAVRAEATPRVVRAEFRAAAKGLLTADQLEALLEDRDLSKYADSKGNPDEAKIEKLVKAFAPAAPPRASGPTTRGLGGRPAPGTAGEQGRAMAEKRFGKPATTA